MLYSFSIFNGKKYHMRTDSDLPVNGTENNIEFYELEKVRFIIKDGSGLDIAYAYEDLVFSEHGIFIFQFDNQSSDSIFCWFNQDCLEADRISILNSLCRSASLNNMKIITRGKFELTQNENEQISVNFKEIKKT